MRKQKKKKVTFFWISKKIFVSLQHEIDGVFIRQGVGSPL